MRCDSADKWRCTRDSHVLDARVFDELSRVRMPLSHSHMPLSHGRVTCTSGVFV
jgi:hypothetical protein